MQSDERVVSALAALSPQIALFRFAVSATLERAKSTLARESGPIQTRDILGEFAFGRIDPARFAMVNAGSAPLDVAGRTAIERAVATLERLVDTGDDAFVVQVEAGRSPAEAIRERFAFLGSAFGAASRVERVRARSWDFVEHNSSFARHPFDEWTQGQRKLAPPLVVLLSGADLDPFELAPLIDGCVRLVLVVSPPCPPAPLVRLVSPGVFVAQSGDPTIVGSISEFDGPAVIALMTGGEARFVHDPRNGYAVWQRIRVDHLPDGVPRKAIGARSAWQQRDDLGHLKSLLDLPLGPSASRAARLAPSDESVSDPVERLTMWLLEQSNQTTAA